MTIAEPMADTFDPLTAIDDFDEWYRRAIILGLAAIDGTLSPDRVATAAEKLPRIVNLDRPSAPSTAMIWPGTGEDVVGWRFVVGDSPAGVDGPAIRDELRRLAVTKPLAFTIWHRETANGKLAERLIFPGIPPVDAFCYLYSPNWSRWDIQSPPASEAR